MKMTKDIRYEVVKTLIETGKIVSLKAIFQIIPMTIIKEDAKMHYSTLQRRIFKPRLLTTDNYLALAELFDVTPQKIFELALYDIRKGLK